jgi:hypothetical protein
MKARISGRAGRGPGCPRHPVLARADPCRVAVPNVAEQQLQTKRGIGQSDRQPKPFDVDPAIRAVLKQNQFVTE